MSSSSGAAERLRAVAEVLRAPLLLSPFADVLAGWSAGIAWGHASSPPTEGDSSVGALLAALVAGCCLLASGMAQNALVDLPDDRARKPTRPLPRGALAVPAVRGLWLALTAIALLCGLLALPLLPWIIGIVAGTSLYHYVLKSHRVAGCLTLGWLRALDMSLGVVAAGAVAPPTGPLGPWVPCGLYFVYVTGAALHASTDDESSAAQVWSRRGTTLARATLLVAIGLVAAQLGRVSLWPAASIVLLAGAGGRLTWALGRRPPPVITGVALSNVYLLAAAVACAAVQPIAGGAVLVLFVVSRRLLKLFPPS